VVVYAQLTLDDKLRPARRVRLSTLCVDGRALVDALVCKVDVPDDQLLSEAVAVHAAAIFDQLLIRSPPRHPRRRATHAAVIVAIGSQHALSTSDHVD